MSYILDALKKSERERALGHVPGLETEQEPHTGSRRRWGWLLAGLVLINVFVLAWLLGERAARPVAPTQASVEMPLPQAQIPVLPALSETDVQTKPLRRVTLSAAQPAVTGEDSLAAGPQTDASVVPGRVVMATEPLSLADDIPESVVAVEQVPLLQDTTVPQVESAPLPPQLAATTASDIPAWRDLDPALRAQLAEPTLDVHVYSNEPERRFILVDLRKYREGDTLSNGAEVYEITHDGAIMDWRGTRFRVTRR